MAKREYKPPRRYALAALLFAILLTLPAILYRIQPQPTTSSNTAGTGVETRAPELEFRRIVLKPEVHVYINGTDYTNPEEDPFGPFMVILLCHMLGCHPTALSLIDETLIADNTICTARYTPPLRPVIRLGNVFAFYFATVNYDTATNTIVFSAEIPDYFFNVKNVSLDFVGSGYACTTVYIPLSEPVNITPGTSVVVSISFPREMPVQNITSLLNRLIGGDGFYNTNATITVCSGGVCGKVSAAALEVVDVTREDINTNITTIRVINATVMITIPFVANGLVDLKVVNSGVTVLDLNVETASPTVFIVTVPLNVYDASVVS